MTAFYNEIDKDAAAWLRELIAEGHIAPGIVDERSIEDVRPDELTGFTQCHFFAGVGIWSLALRASGIPDDYSIWTGSCPCQPFSSAGKGDGFDDERHLWPAFHYLISQRRPTAILGEQVASKDAEPWIDLVHTDMEAMGYAFGAIPFPTAGIGGPHIRDRLYWGAFSSGVTLGDTGSKGLQGLGGHGDHGNKPGWLDALTAGSVTAAGEFGKLGHPQSRGFGERGNAQLPGSGGHADGASDAVDGLAYPGRVDHRGEVKAANHGQPQANGPADQLGGCGAASCGMAVSGSQRHDGRGTAGTAGTAGGGWPDAAGYSSPVDRLADLHSDGRNQAGQHIATPRGDGTFGDGSTGGPGPVNGFWRDADWLHCRDGKWRPVEPGTQPLAYGMPRSMGDLSPELQRLASLAGLSKASLKRAKQFRVGSLRGYGNAINAIAAQTFIESVMESTNHGNASGVLWRAVK